MKNKRIGTLKLYVTMNKNNNANCEYYYYNDIDYKKGNTKAIGFGYDKQSSALSNAINKFSDKFILKKCLKWESDTSASCIDKNTNRSYYGVYKDKTISYGIGCKAVVNCLDCFTNVKVKYQDEYKNFYILVLEIKEG